MTYDDSFTLMEDRHQVYEIVLICVYDLYLSCSVFYLRSLYENTPGQRLLKEALLKIS